MNKSFVILLVIAVTWGVSLGVAFIVGLTMGKTQSDVETLAVPASFQTSPAQADEVSQFGQGQREDLRRRIESGDISQEELDRFRQQFRDGSERGGPGGGGSRRGGFGDHADGQNGAVDSGRELHEAPTPQPSN
ncbi:MAG: hypothetical protein IIC83_11650 [Chloroflexi bacterium]|nr:hypothetical protein [Chloroflexota bacterium]